MTDTTYQPITHGPDLSLYIDTNSHHLQWINIRDAQPEPFEMFCYTCTDWHHWNRIHITERATND